MQYIDFLCLDAAKELLWSLLDTLRQTSDEKALCRKHVLIRISNDQKFMDMIHSMNISDLVKDHARHLLRIVSKEDPAYVSDDYKLISYQAITATSSYSSQLCFIYQEIWISYIVYRALLLHTSIISHKVTPCVVDGRTSVPFVSPSA